MSKWEQALVVFLDGCLAGVFPLLAASVPLTGGYLRMAGWAAVAGGLTSLYRYRQQQATVVSSQTVTTVEKTQTVSEPPAPAPKPEG